MADTVVTITDGSVSKSFTYPQARWDKVVAWWKREGPLAVTEYGEQGERTCCCC